MKGLKTLFSPMAKVAMLLSCLMTLTGMEAKTFTVNVGQFQKLKVNGNLEVVYRNLPDSTGFARYDSSVNEEIFTFSTKGDGQLKIEPSEAFWGKDNLPVVYVYSDFLTNLESYSEKKVEVESLSPSATFSVNLVGNGIVNVENVKSNQVSAAITTGNGTIFISGSCQNANFRMVGAGMISADRLKADNVKCRILGTGTIGCWPIEKLNVSGLGSTKIYYKGNPFIKKTGGGKLYELPEENGDTYGGTEDVAPVFQPRYQEEEEMEEAEETEEKNKGGLEEDEEADEGDEDEDGYQTIVTADD